MTKIKIIFIIGLILFLNSAFIVNAEKATVTQNKYNKIVVTKHNKLKNQNLARIILGILVFITAFLVIFVRIRIGHETKKRKLNKILNEKKK